MTMMLARKLGLELENVYPGLVTLTSREHLASEISSCTMEVLYTAWLQNLPFAAAQKRTLANTVGILGMAQKEGPIQSHG